MTTPLLKVNNLTTVFHSKNGIAPAVDDVSLDIGVSDSLGLVGESGSGKSITALSIMGLIPSPPGEITAGTIEFNGINLLNCTNKQMRNIRGNKIAMIFQDPMTSLNPVINCGKQISESIILHKKVSKKEATLQAIDLLSQVGIPMPKKIIKSYPHELSGGMRQRVMIAMAIACDISLLIADEPTTALDVTVQAQILELLGKLQEEKNMSLLLITHDLGVVVQNTKNVAVMYAGELQEIASTEELFDNPTHPYTRGLLASIPKIDKKRDVLASIEGSVPSPFSYPKGCRFKDRCNIGCSDCEKTKPKLKEVSPRHFVRCLKV